MNTNESIRGATLIDRFRGSIHASIENANFYEEARKEVWNESEKSSFSKFWSMPMWKYNDLLYDRYKGLIPFWRQTLGDETAKHAVKLLVLYSDYLLGSMVSLVDRQALLGNSDGVEELYSKYYKPNATGKEMRSMIKEIKAEAGIRIRRY